VATALQPGLAGLASLGRAREVTRVLLHRSSTVRRHAKAPWRFAGGPKVLPGKRPMTFGLSLICAVLELSSRGWSGVVMTPKTVTEIESLPCQQGSTDNDELATPKRLGRGPWRACQVSNAG
jgi:hypothetical protein